MATKEKTPNYTDAQVALIKAEYLAIADKSYEDRKAHIDTLAEKIGKSARSIVAKLSKEGVYKPAEYVSKTGEKPIKKDVHADAIGAILKLSEPDIDSLTKANKTALVKVFGALRDSIPKETESAECEANKVDFVNRIAEWADLDEKDTISLSRANSVVLGKIVATFAPVVQGE